MSIHFHRTVASDQMDISLSFLHLLVLFVSLALVFVVYKRKSSNIKLPPGTKGWPLLGENLEFMMANRGGEPEKFINDRVSKYSQDAFRTSLLGQNMVVFCGPTLNKLLFTSDKKYVKAWLPQSISRLVFDPDLTNAFDSDSVTIMIHKILPDFLKPQALRCHVPIMDSMAKEHLEMDWSPYKQVKAYPLTTEYTFALACRLFFSVKDPNLVSRLSGPYGLLKAGLYSVPINLPGTAYNKAIKAKKAILRDIIGIIERRKQELSEKIDVTSQDLLTRALLFKEENGSNSKQITEREAANLILSLLFASHGTVSSSITFVLKFLADNPQAFSKVFEEQMEIAKSKGPKELLNWDDIQKMKYSWYVACETMRLVPPALGTFREAITDFTADEGFTIPMGWKIYWAPHTTHKNPKYFPDPEKFDPSRFERDEPAPYTFVPFGGGPHMCPGKEYARMAVLTFMHNMITKFKWKNAIADEKIIYNSSPIPANDFPIHLEPF